MYIKLLVIGLFSFINFSAYAQTNIDDYINTIQKELKKDISSVENKARTSYYKPKDDPSKQSMPVIRDAGGNFSPYFNTISEVNNDSVKFFVNYYSTFGKRKLESIVARFAEYFPIISRYAQQYNVPIELALIGFLESEFDPDSKLASGKVGIWNLSRSTAKIYGLEINDYLDERKDIEKSTDVAFKYLLGLKEAFHNNWDLVIASYNGGGSYINQKLREEKINNFWDILEKEKDYASSSLEYVPRFYALLTILKHPSRYNLEVPQFSESSIRYDKVIATKTGVSFKDLARLTNVSVNELVALNPQFTKQYTVNSANMYVPIRLARLTKSRIRVAKAHKLRWITSGANLSKNQYAVAYSKKRKNPSNNKYYSVKKKDTLTSIARRYKMSVSQLAKNNNIKHTAVLKVGKMIKIASAAPLRGESTRNKKKVYNVRKGDTLFSIARKYNVAVNSIKTPSRTSFIKPGDTVTIS